MIRKYLNQHGIEVWEVYVNIRNPNNSSQRIQKRLKGLKTEALTKKQELHLMRECERELVVKGQQGINWSDLIDRYELGLRADQDSEMTATTKIDYVATLRKHTHFLYKREVNSLTTKDMKEVFALAGQTVTGKHLVKLRTIITGVFNYGIDHGLIKLLVPPTQAIKFKKEEDKKPEILTLTEIQKLLSSAKQVDYKWYPIWAVALLTGMRNGELYALLWSDIDFDSKLISVTKSFNKRTRETKATKAGYWRTVPISDELMLQLKELKLKSNGSEFVLPRLREWKKGYQARELRYFCSSIGLPSIKFHTLRACFATQLLRSGVPSPQIQKICGWKDLETMQIYIRLAGIEVSGATNSLKFLPDAQAIGEVVSLFG